MVAAVAAAEEAPKLPPGGCACGCCCCSQGFGGDGWAALGWGAIVAELPSLYASSELVCSLACLRRLVLLRLLLREGGREQGKVGTSDWCGCIEPLTERL